MGKPSAFILQQFKDAHRVYLPVYWVGLVKDGPDGWRAALQKFIRALDTRCGGLPILPAVFCLQSRDMSANILHVHSTDTSHVHSTDDAWRRAQRGVAS